MLYTKTFILSSTSICTFLIMTTLKNYLISIIQRTLPSLSEEITLQITERLLNSGLDTRDDLKYVQADDIKDLLPVIQQRKLTDAFKAETETVILNIEALPCPFQEPDQNVTFNPVPGSPSSSSSCHPLTSESEESPRSQRKKFWPDTLKVPWELMPQEIRSAIALGKRPSPDSRRQMVRIIADDLRKNDTNPTRVQCQIVCKSIIRQYPNIFGDRVGSGQILGTGYESLLTQIKNRLDNLNRTSSIRHHRSSSHGQKRGPTDTYGCTSFEPAMPPEETEETLEEQRKKLEEIHAREGVDGGERADVNKMMHTTFKLQRTHINAIPAQNITELKSNWPYLFTQKGLYNHFEQLTDISVLHTLERSLDECGKAIIEYFRMKPTNADVKQVLKLSPDVEMTFVVLQLLMAHFSETLSGLVLTATEFTSINELEETLPLPASARLILLGDTGGQCIRQWKISLEGKIICTGIQATFSTGLAAVFSLYYILNLQYQLEAACTLEFIQRRFIGINPERGTKRLRREAVSKKTGKVTIRKSATVNPRVSALVRKLKDFEWDFI